MYLYTLYIKISLQHPFTNESRNRSKTHSIPPPTIFPNFKMIFVISHRYNCIVIPDLFPTDFRYVCV